MLRTPPAQRFRDAIATASLPHLIRLAGKLHAEDLRNTDPSSRQTSLVRAAATGRLDVVEWLIDEGHEEGEISRDASGDTMLHVAAAEGYVGIMELYLSRYPFVLDWVNSRGATPLHIAAMKGEVECAQLLVDYGADINAPDLLGNTPLHWASSWGKLPVVKLLIELGCQVGAKNNEGFTAAEYSFSFEGMKALEEYARAYFEYSKRTHRSRKASRTPHLEGSPKPRRDSFSNPSPPNVDNDAANVGLGFTFNAVAGPSHSLPVPPLRTKSSSSQITPSNSLAALATTSTALVTPPSTGTLPRTTTSLSPINLKRVGRSGSSSSNISTVLPASPASDSIRKISLRDQGVIETFRTIQGGSIGLPSRSQSFNATSTPAPTLPPSRSTSFSTTQSDLPPRPPATRERSESNNSLLSTSSAALSALTSRSRSGSNLSTPSLDPLPSTKPLPSPTPLRPPSISPTPPPPPPNSSKPSPPATTGRSEMTGKKSERRMSAVGVSIVDEGPARGRSGSNESTVSGGRVARALGLGKRS